MEVGNELQREENVLTNPTTTTTTTTTTTIVRKIKQYLSSLFLVFLLSFFL